jgi:hypothetical protein
MKPSYQKISTEEWRQETIENTEMCLKGVWATVKYICVIGFPEEDTFIYVLIGSRSNVWRNTGREISKTDAKTCINTQSRSSVHTEQVSRKSEVEPS